MRVVVGRRSVGWGGEEKFDVFDKALEITKEKRAVFVSVMAGDLSKTSNFS